MNFIKYVVSITVCILLLQESIVDTTPIQSVVRKSLLLKRVRSKSLRGKFLHITDIHVDPHYLVGSDPDTLCHRKTENSTNLVGQFGALGFLCDSPIPLVHATFEFLHENIQDIDFIIYTGDTVRHDRDVNLTRTNSEILDAHKQITRLFQMAYNIKSIPYLPTLGNNDSFKYNEFLEDDPIYKQLLEIWKPLGLNLTEDFKNGGYFVQDLVKDKLTVINLNSMFFFKQDYNAVDCDVESSPGAIEMAWLEDLLQKYQEKGGGHQLYVMSHVPPMADNATPFYLPNCHVQYLDLMARYGSIISGHFTGHTNFDNIFAVAPLKQGSRQYSYVAPNSSDIDQFRLTLPKSSMAIFNAPSIIPANNPAIRVYTYDFEGTTYPFGTIRDWDQYYVDLRAANKKGKVEFQLEYKASELYGVDHFDGPGVGQAVLNVANNPETLEKYIRYINVSSPFRG